MPLTRYQIRSEHTLADPELYRAAEKDDPEAILEGVAMAGLVGVLRQLGDLAEFAAEIFHDLHEEVMETAARGHGLMVRVQQLEAECPSIEKAFLSQTDHSTFFHNKGVDWHPNQRVDQNLITGSHLPRFVMDSYDECRGPPRLFLLDKFDIAGAGACLKRYTDPSFFKGETEAQRDHKIRKVKKKGSRWRNGGTPEVVPTSHAKLHQLLEEERVQNGNNDPARLVKLKRRQLNGPAFVSNTGKSYMEKFLETPSHDEKSISQVSVSAVPVESTVNSTCDSIHEIVEIGMVSPTKEKLQRKRTAFSSPYTQETDLKLRMEDLSEVATDGEILRVPEAESAGEADRNLFTAQEVDGKKDFTVVGDIKKEGSIDDYHSDDVSSEVDNYVDAFPTMESDMDTDSEYRLGNNLSFLSIEKHGTDCEANEEAYDLRQSSDSQSIRNSSTSVDGSSSTKKGIYSSSYSDTMSNLAENILSDGDCSAKMFPSIGCVTEAVSPSPNQSSASEKISGTKTLEIVAFNSTSIEGVAQISRHRSDQGEASCSSCLTDFDPTPVSLNPGASSVVDSSDYTKHCIGSLNADGNGRTLCDDSQVTSHVDAPSETSKVSLPQVSAEFHPVDEVVDPDNSNISSDVLLHMTISDVSPGKKIEGSIVRKMCQAEQADDSSTEKLVNGTHSATSPRGEQLPDLPFPGLETCSKLKPELPNSLADSSVVDEVDMASSAGVDAVTTVVDNKTDSTPAAGLNSQEIAAINNQVDAISASGVHSENLDTAADSRQSVSFSEQHLSKVSHDVSPLELDSLEVNGRHSGGQVTDEWASSSLNDGENGSSTTDLDRLGNSDFPGDPILEDLVQIADMASETAQVDAAATFATAMAPSAIVDGVEDDVNDVTCPSSDQICSPSWNSGDSEDTLSTSGRSNKDLEFNETIHPIPLGGSEMQKEVNQLSAAPALSFLCDATPGDNSNSKGIGDAANLSLAEKKEGLSSKQVDQNLETSPTKSRSDLVENIEYSVSLSYDHSPEPNIPLEQNQKLLVNQSEVDCLHGNKMNSVPLNDQLLDMHPSCPMDQDKSSGVPSKVCSEDLLNLYSAPQPLQQPDDPNLESCVKSTGPLVSIFPSFVQLPKENPVNLEEMPPLPPLPPMQWRVGKLPEVPKPSGEETSSHGLGSIPLLLPCKMADEHAHIGIPLLEVGSESQNPYFPSSTTQQEEKPDHVSGCSAEDMAQPSEVTLQLPTANDDDIQHDLLTSNESKPPSPSIALPPMSNELHQNGLPVSEGEMVQNLKSLSVTQSIEGAVPKHLPILLQEKPIENLNQIEAETSLEDKNHQQAFESSEGDMLNPPRTFVSLPTTEAGQSQDHQHASQTTDVEPLPPPSEDEKLNGKPLMKIPRPRDPLIEAVAAHDKSKLKKVTERVRPQIVAKVDNRDSLLEQIRAKSFNLKPAAVARPSIQGPNTNLRVAAILEKANAIRQALAGSDEDDDADSWSSDT